MSVGDLRQEARVGTANAGRATRLWSGLTVIAVVASTLPLAVNLIRSGLYAEYHTDEFTYAHAAWLIAQGQLPFRDFFCHHFPLAFHILAVPLLFLDDNPENIFWLRVSVLPVAFVICAIAAYINAREDRTWGLLTPLVLLSVGLVTRFTTEIRPDPIAFTLFLFAVAVLYPRRRGTALRAVLSGAALTLAVWASEKVAIYGSVFVVAFVLDILHNRKHRQSYLLANPYLFAVGCLAIAGFIGLHLVLTGGLAGWIEHSLVWSMTYQEHHEGHSWVLLLRTAFSDIWWFLPFALMGCAATWRRVGESGENRWSHPDILLLGAVGTTFVSCMIQKAPYNYSLLPLVGLLGIFGARGIACAVRALLIQDKPTTTAMASWLLLFLSLRFWQEFYYVWHPFVLLCLFVALPQVALWAITRRRGLSRPANKRERTAVLVLVICFLGWRIVNAGWNFERRLASENNRLQHKFLATIHELTTKEDPIYDNTGQYVTRPHATFYYFTNAYIRGQMQRREIRERVRKEIIASGCTVALHDARFHSLPRPLRRFVVENYQPYTRDIWIAGRRYTPGAEAGGAFEFHAFRTGVYFIDPPSILKTGKISVDGVNVTSAVFEIRAGKREVQYEGPATEFYILWLPRNEERFSPIDERSGFHGKTGDVKE